MARDCPPLTEERSPPAPFCEPPPTAANSPEATFACPPPTAANRPAARLAWPPATAEPAAVRTFSPPALDREWRGYQTPVDVERMFPRRR